MRKVKNWRGSTAAKIIAWIALSASALCFVFSAMGVIFMFDEGIYRNSKDETRKQWFENVSYEYGLSAVDDVRREQPAGSVESKYALILALLLLLASIIALFYIYSFDKDNRTLLEQVENRRNQNATLRLLNEMIPLQDGNLTKKFGNTRVRLLYELD